LLFEGTKIPADTEMLLIYVLHSNVFAYKVTQDDVFAGFAGANCVVDMVNGLISCTGSTG
jgi:hypothetical protein